MLLSNIFILHKSRHEFTLYTFNYRPSSLKSDILLSVSVLVRVKISILQECILIEVMLLLKTLAFWMVRLFPVLDMDTVRDTPYELCKALLWWTDKINGFHGWDSFNRFSESFNRLGGLREGQSFLRESILLWTKWTQWIHAFNTKVHAILYHI